MDQLATNLKFRVKPNISREKRRNSVSIIKISKKHYKLR